MGLSAPAADKTPWFINLSFDYTLQLINGISSDLEDLLRYYNGTAIVVLFKIPFTPPTAVFLNNLAL